MAMENDRNFSCFNCEYFSPNSASQIDGACLRHAPSKLDEENSVAMYGEIQGMFGQVVSSNLERCGEFKTASQPIPPVE